MGNAWWVILGIGALVGYLIGKANADSTERQRVEQLRDAQEAEGHRQEQEFGRQKRELQQLGEQRELAFQQLVAQAREFHNELQLGMLRGRKWLAAAFAEFVDTRNSEIECWLAAKPHPATKAAEQVASVRKRVRETVRRVKLLEYQVRSYEEYFPLLADYRDAILDESIDLREGALETLEQADAALSFGYLSKEEYDRLSTVEKFQLALDRYWDRPKNQWQIGRLYERFIGAIYEKDGWRVTYQGIMKGREDFGRDLICEKGGESHVVQCKCWSKEKVIREKHVFQLFGTTVLLRLGVGREQPPSEGSLFPACVGGNITPVLATTTSLSAEAMAVATHLAVEVWHEPLRRYPMIKCNVNPATKERIYHLPFDQQYDNVVIGNMPGEFYAETVADAEAAGFRRAFRWRGD